MATLTDLHEQAAEAPETLNCSEALQLGDEFFYQSHEELLELLDPYGDRAADMLLENY